VQVLNAYSLIAKHLHARLTRVAHASNFLILATTALICSSVSHLAIKIIEIVPAKFIALRISENEEFNLSENLRRAPKAMCSLSLSLARFLFKMYHRMSSIIQILPWYLHFPLKRTSSALIRTCTISYCISLFSFQGFYFPFFSFFGLWSQISRIVDTFAARIGKVDHKSWTTAVVTSRWMNRWKSRWLTVLFKH